MLTEPGMIVFTAVRGSKLGCLQPRPRAFIFQRFFSSGTYRYFGKGIAQPSLKLDYPENLVPSAGLGYIGLLAG